MENRKNNEQVLAQAEETVANTVEQTDDELDHLSGAFARPMYGCIDCIHS